jgi:hypothetical protein
MSHWYYGNGEFEYIRDPLSRALYKNIHNAITKTELWGWMRKYKPVENAGFMTHNIPELWRIYETMWEDPIAENHTNESLDGIILEMSYCAKYGYDALKRDIMKYYEENEENEENEK